MNPRLLLLFLLTLPGILLAQPDQQSPKGVDQAAMTIDSLTQHYLQVPDSLLPALGSADSIRRNFNLVADSIQSEYKQAISSLDSTTDKLNRTIDSLQHLDLPSRKYTRKLQALEKSRQKTVAKFSRKLNDLKAKTTGKLDALDLPPEYKEPLQKLTKNIDGLNLDSNIRIPELNIPGYQLPKLEGIGNLSFKGGQIGNIGLPDNLPDIKAPTGDPGNVTRQIDGYKNEMKDLAPGDLGQVSRQVQAYQDDIKDITEGNLEDVQKLPETIEQQASQIDGMDELQKQSGMIDQHKAMLDDFKDPEKAKERAVAMAKEAAVDHFAGKQEQLKSAMEKISKYKQKYSSVSSLKDLPKRPPNPMKSKPFIERLVPGLYFQYQQKDFYLIDVNPYLGYKLSGRFSAGLGWNHRYAYDKNNRSFSSRARIFGPRGYVDFKLGKGFIAHIEGESMNSFVPSALVGNPDTGRREWVWSIMTGLKKEYRIYKNLKGTALIQYNLFNRYYKAPYVDRLNSRIGFEYTLKKAKKRRKTDNRF